MDQDKQKIINDACAVIRSALNTGDAFPFVTFARGMWQAILEELEGKEPAPTEYRVLTDWGSADKLCAKVEALMKEGWRLQGGVSISHSQGNERIFAQAMVR